MQEQRGQQVAWNIILIVAGLVLGFILAAQWNITSPEAAPAQPAREDLASTIKRLEEEQEALKLTISQMRAELIERQKELVRSLELVEDTTTELDQQRAVAGLYPLRGPGVRVLLADSATTNNPSVSANLNDYIVHDYDLRDVVNTLWAANAEAIAINDERVVSTTSITCVGNTIMVNDTRLSPPYEIKAIGNIESLRRALTDPTVLQDLRNRAKTLGIQFTVTDRRDITVPAFRGSFRIQHAQPSS